jgi:hypothetical protein
MCEGRSRALIEIANSRDVVLSVLADDGARMAEQHSGVVTRVAMDDVSLIHRGHNDHVMLSCLARYERAAFGG